MSIYLIRLKPIGSFFFGNERGFGFVENKNEHYIVKSNYIPQQSSILGMMRKELLVRKGLLKSDWDYSGKEREIHELIGEKGFNISSDEQSFGAIKSISPIFLMEGSKAYITTPFDHMNDGVNLYHPFELGETIKSCCGYIKALKHYSAKRGIFDGWMDVESDEVISSDEIYTTDERIGIQKNQKGGTDEQAYFKMVYKRFEKDYEFSFYFDLDDRFDVNLENNIVFVGAKNSAFYMKAEKVEQGFSALAKGIKTRDRLILMSDTLVDEEILNRVNFSISDTVDYRNMAPRSSSEPIKYSKNQKIQYKYNLWKRGSVVFSDNIEELARMIDSKKNMIKAGYNITNFTYI